MANNLESEKKPIYKKWWFWAIIVVVILAIGGAGANNQNANTTTSSSSDASINTLNEVTTDNTSDGAENVRVTLAQYEQIEDGMTYDEVVSIFGGKETSSSESEIAGIKSKIMTWNGNATFSAVTIGFTDGKVSSKSQTGLE